MPITSLNARCSTLKPNSDRLPADDHPRCGNELNLELEERFAAGKGVINLSPLYTDAQILTLIKIACRWSQGAAFQVIPATSKPISTPSLTE